MRRIVLYPFTYYDIRTRRWWKARYVAEIDVMVERYAAVRIAGAPEVREVPDDWRALTAGHLARP